MHICNKFYHMTTSRTNSWFEVTPSPYSLKPSHSPSPFLTNLKVHTHARMSKRASSRTHNHNRTLVWALTKRDIKLQYHRTRFSFKIDPSFSVQAYEIPWRSQKTWAFPILFSISSYSSITFCYWLHRNLYLVFHSPDNSFNILLPFS